MYGLTIMLDPGHGGSDPGATYEGVYEKTLNDRLTKVLADKLKAKGANVVYTRKPGQDIRLELEDRTELANRSNPDLFLSIHHDSYYQPGYSMFYSSYRPNIETSGAYFKDDNGKTHHIIREEDGKAYYNQDGKEKYIVIKTTKYRVYDATPSFAAQIKDKSKKIADKSKEKIERMQKERKEKSKTTQEEKNIQKDNNQEKKNKDHAQKEDKNKKLKNNK